jgi:hypothetical protein
MECGERFQNADLPLDRPAVRFDAACPAHHAQPLIGCDAPNHNLNHRHTRDRADGLAVSRDWSRHQVGINTTRCKDSQNGQTLPLIRLRGFLAPVSRAMNHGNQQ